MDYDTIIVGGGLAGAAAALHLSRTERVLLVEAERPAAGASGAAAGLVNPLMGRRARRPWQAEQALEALHATLALAGAAGLFRPGLLRPATDPDQAACFREAARAHPHLGSWCTPAEVRALFPPVQAPHGALYVHAGGAVPVPAFVEAMLAAAQRRGTVVRTGTRLTGWRETARYVEAILEHDSDRTRCRTGRLLLAPGADYTRFPALAGLPLHGVKGQTVRVRLPGHGDLGALPSLSGNGYVVVESDTLVVGSSYEHRFLDRRPSDETSRRLLARAVRMLPLLRQAQPVSATAGVRVTVPGRRLPLLGPLPAHPRLWVFTGLGSKGLLMAPWIARHLAGPEAIPAELRVPENL
ncbi:FAD-binding oxidoreductase [Rhodocaloribacter litoris]|uniref:NAD(P)/FAD-dependent oxidoreductase n=1 Tax=Rhodocaloribacter litoris TaxID=2558931 RepID=UPI00141F76A6|nr:FAD-dependent oxidoreductase [Rhodocaloribacter litoris]QXD15541.1 FAD-binding oxidoreductase [Rhodocaloribacter litoris]